MAHKVVSQLLKEYLYLRQTQGDSRLRHTALVKVAMQRLRCVKANSQFSVLKLICHALSSCYDVAVYNVRPISIIGHCLDHLRGRAPTIL